LNYYSDKQTKIYTCCLLQNVKEFSMKKFCFVLLTLVTLTTSLFATSEVIWGGARSSFYGIDPFPEDSSWTFIGKNIQKSSSASTPVQIWILGHIDASGNCVLEFEQPHFVTTVPDNIVFLEDINGSNDGFQFNDHEATLTHFDKHGIKVFLQVEPGLADISTLMDIVITKFGHHESVIGFGIDIEWYEVDTDENPNGTIVDTDTIWWNQVTDSAAQQWEDTLVTYNSTYQLFLKHWLAEIMSPIYRGNILYINDSQDFTWGDNPEWGDGALEEMVKEFVGWAEYFSEAPVGFQIGYPNDTTWWCKLSDPITTISSTIISGMNDAGLSQEVGMFWVDFTLYNPVLSFIWENHDDVGIEDRQQNKLINPSIMEQTSNKLLFSEPISSLSIYAVNGRVITTINNIYAAQIETGFLAPGSYLIEAESFSGFSEVSRIVVH